MKSFNRLRIALVHDNLNSCGGAERLALTIAATLKELDHFVDLYVLKKTDWDRVRNMTYYDRSVVDNEYVIPFLKMTKTVYSRILNWFARDAIGIHMIRRRNYDLIFATKQILVPIIADMLYMHFPDFLPGFDYLYYADRYFYNIPLRIYSRPLEIMIRMLTALFKSLEYKPLILTNSRFSAMIINKFLRVDALVLHPPVDIERYLPLSQNRDRQDIVVTISRIDPIKNLDVVLEVAKEIKSAKFIIIGSISSYDYYSHLVKKLKTYKLGERVKIVSNATEEQKMEILRKAKVYLHPMKYEHFGIAVVEAMAAGLVPIVHKNSGSWTDIVEFGRYGLGFNDIEELVEKFDTLLSSPGAWMEFALKAFKRAKLFSKRYFKLKLNAILNKFVEHLKSSQDA
ncbi:MAG: hypothetical protein B6U76_00730 [Desulfurococcales archaeon ex4484_217_2]|nr:MAG: hypothetical protein B6U76_00730 [Desulfurococcales archaeon ex4484_217_2]